MISRNRFLLMIMLIMIAIGLVSCANGGGMAAGGEEVSLRLKWKHQAQFAGFYVADQEGYYADKNINISIEPVDLDSQITIDNLLAGDNDIVIGAPEEVIIARSEGKPVRAIAVIYRISPIVYMSKAETGIESPEDLIGKTVAISPGQGRYLYEAMMGTTDVDRSQIDEKDMDAWGFDCWDTADVCSFYATNQLVRANYEDIEVNALWPKDYGVSYYADVIITTDDFIAENPELVASFVQATLKGWQSAIDDPEKAITALLEYNPEADKDYQLRSMKASIPLIQPGNEVLGIMNEEDWQGMMDILLEQGIIDSAIDLSTLYTNEFIK